MTHIVTTSKHHDGFAMYHSKVNRQHRGRHAYEALRSPFGDEFGDSASRLRTVTATPSYRRERIGAALPNPANSTSPFSGRRAMVLSCHPLRPRSRKSIS